VSTFDLKLRVLAYSKVSTRVVLDGEGVILNADGVSARRPLGQKRT